MTDKVFGELTYSGGWCKKETLSLWGKDIEVKIVVSAYENEEPNEAQQDAYSRLKTDLSEISKITLKKLNKYMKDIEEDITLYGSIQDIPESVFDVLTVNEILFMENGIFGIMCGTKWDSHGVAVVCKECEIEVGPQDIIWSEE